MLSLESLYPNSEIIEGIYKTHNFINDIAFGAFLFVFCDLNTYFPRFSRGQSFFPKISKNNEVATFKKSSVLPVNDRYLRFCKCSTDDNVFKSLKYVSNNVN